MYKGKGGYKWERGMCIINNDHFIEKLVIFPISSHWSEWLSLYSLDYSWTSHWTPIRLATCTSPRSTTSMHHSRRFLSVRPHFRMWVFLYNKNNTSAVFSVVVPTALIANLCCSFHIGALLVHSSVVSHDSRILVSVGVFHETADKLVVLKSALKLWAIW